MRHPVVMSNQPMRVIALLLIAAIVAGCNQTSNTTAPRDKTTAEKAGEAGAKARKKAEQIKSDENKKAQETNDAMNP